MRPAITHQHTSGFQVIFAAPVYFSAYLLGVFQSLCEINLSFIAAVLREGVDDRRASLT